MYYISWSGDCPTYLLASGAPAINRFSRKELVWSLSSSWDFCVFPSEARLIRCYSEHEAPVEAEPIPVAFRPGASELRVSTIKKLLHTWLGPWSSRSSLPTLWVMTWLWTVVLLYNFFIFLLFFSSPGPIPCSVKCPLILIAVPSVVQSRSRHLWVFLFTLSVLFLKKILKINKNKMNQMGPPKL